MSAPSSPSSNIEPPPADIAARAGSHIPVMLNEIIEGLEIKDGGIYVDGTFGAGGYSRAILQKADCRLIGIDQDPYAAPRATKLKAEFGPRFDLLAGNFGQLDQLSADHLGLNETAQRNGFLDGIVLDIGVSSFQIDEGARGFSFQKEGPLDMRMSGVGVSAADVLAHFSEDELADLFYLYGDEAFGRQIARAIVSDRKETPFLDTLSLAGLVGRVARARQIGKNGGGKSKKGSKSINPATKVFQALRIYVNDELGALAAGLMAAERALKPGGRLVVVSFHSLEDRMVKQFLAGPEKGANRSRHIPEMGAAVHYFLAKPNRAIGPSEAETDLNPRARSAKMRIGVRTEEAARSISPFSGTEEMAWAEIARHSKLPRIETIAKKAASQRGNSGADLKGMGS